MIQNYWGKERLHHRAAPITMNYASEESLRLIIKEGLDAVYNRHWSLGRGLQAGLENMELTLSVVEEYRLPQLTTVRIAGGADDLAVRIQFFQEYGTAEDWANGLFLL